MVGVGHPGLNPKRGVGRSGRESVMAIDRFCQNVVGPPDGGARPWVLWCGYSALALQSVCVKSIDSRARG